LAVEGMGEPLLAVGRQIGDMTDLAERLGEIVGCIAIVFNDEKSHDDPADDPIHFAADRHLRFGSTNPMPT
jgi:hypothetical protein